MRTAALLRALAATALLTVACGTTTGSGTATPTVASSPTPKGVCDSAHRCLALVTLRGSNAIVVRDITDITHPKTVGSLGEIGLPPYPSAPPQFVSETELSYVDGARIVRVPLSGSPKSTVADSQQVVGLRWSPDGEAAAYMRQISQSKSELHLVTAGQDRMLGSVPGLPEVFGCESQECADRWDFVFAYSPDGHFISWAQNVTGVFRIWAADGSDVTPSVPELPFMTVWSGSGLYFRDSKGVEVYRNGAVSTFLPGTAWMFPDASPGGTEIVYEKRDATGSAHVFVVDTATAKVRELAKDREGPVFLTSRYVWYRGASTTYIYDLQTGTESTSMITGVYDVWPHAA
jgi:hypothetical protein